MDLGLGLGLDQYHGPGLGLENRGLGLIFGFGLNLGPDLGLDLGLDIIYRGLDLYPTMSRRMKTKVPCYRSGIDGPTHLKEENKRCSAQCVFTHGVPIQEKDGSLQEASSSLSSSSSLH